MALTELEHVALAVIWRDGPCTPYHVRKQFLDSPTPRWSGSAGALYPLMRRIEEQGLVSWRSAGDGRGARHYKVTAAGRRALAGWMRPPLDAAAIGPLEDPIRTRLLFLEALAPKDRGPFLACVAEQLDEHVVQQREVERTARATGDPIVLLAARGNLQVARARQRWFREVCEHLG